MIYNMKLPEKEEIIMEITYRQVGDYLIPNLYYPKMPPIGKYGRMRNRYLEEFHPGQHETLLMTCQLADHLVEIDKAAQNRLEQMMPQLAKEAGATEQLKASDPMKWVGLMNTCKAQAEEIILNELIYA